MEIRRKLINEIKDHDRNMNARVAAIQKRKLLGVDEEAVPYTQINENDVRKMEEITNLLKQLLEKQLLIISQFKDNITQYSKDEKYILEVSQIETIKSAYNSIVSVYLNPRNTQETKTYLKKALISLEHYIIEIVNKLRDIIGYTRWNKATPFNSLIRAFTLYEIILKQFDKGVFHVITDNDIKHDLEINMKKNMLDNILLRSDYYLKILQITMMILVMILKNYHDTHRDGFLIHQQNILIYREMM